MCQNTSNEEKKQKREIHRYAKINPNDPGPYTKEPEPVPIPVTRVEQEPAKPPKKGKDASKSEEK